MKQPVVKIEKDSIDNLLEAVGALAVFINIILAVTWYGDLPDTIPNHFGPDGEPDAFGSKLTIWMLPIISTVTFMGMWVMVQYPHRLNYAVKITPENAAAQYRLSTRIMRALIALVSLMLCYITYAMVQSALGAQKGLSPVVMFMFLGCIVVVTGYSFYRMMKK